MNSEDRKHIIEIWKTIVDVQRHFNDISMRIRAMFVTILLATFAAIGFLLNKELNLEAGDFDVQFATVVPLYGVFVTYLFYFIDRYWYHRLLVGSVKHAIIIEKKYKEEIPELALSETIGMESPYEPGCVVRCLAKVVLVRHEQFRETGKLHSVGKIEFFYKSVMAVLLLTALLVGLLGGVTARPTPTSETSSQSSSARSPSTLNMDEDVMLLGPGGQVAAPSLGFGYRETLTHLPLSTATEFGSSLGSRSASDAAGEACL